MKLNYNILDLLRTPRLAFSLTKIIIFARANIVGYFVYFVANYLALFLSGKSILDIWNNHGIYPCAYIYELPWYASVLFWLSAAYWILAIYGSIASASKTTYQELKGDHFFSAGDAHKYLEKYWHPIIFAPFSIIAILLFYVLAASCFALIGKMPWIGELIFAIPYIIHLFGSVFAFFTFFVLVVSVIYSPIIVGTLKEDTMGTVFNSYMISWRFPIHIALYHLVLFPIIYLSQLILMVSILSGFKILNSIFGIDLFMAEKLNNIVGQAAYSVWPKDLFSFIHGSYLTGFYDFFVPLSNGNLGGTETVSSVIVGFFLFVIIIIWFSYCLSLFTVGETLIFNIFKKRMGTDLLMINHEKEIENIKENMEPNQSIG